MALPTLFGRRREMMSGASDPFTAMRREMDRLFDEFRGVGGGPYAALEADFAPAIDMRETEKGIEITAELPGIEEKDIDISLADNVLTLKGEKKAEREEKGKGWYFSERSHGSFSRSIPLPVEVAEDKVNAQFKNGVLKIELPAAPETQRKAKRIQVKSG